MSKQKTTETSQEVITTTESRELQLTSRIRALIGAPDLANAQDLDRLVYARLVTDPGIEAAERDGWRGAVNRWAAFATEQTDEETGEVQHIPTLALMSPDGDVVRLSGWPSITSWATILKALGEERCKRGIPVRVHRRLSGTVGRSYWVVSIDCVPGDFSLSNEQE